MHFSWVRPGMEARLGFAFRVGRGGGASNLVGVLGALLSSHRIVCYLAASGVGTRRPSIAHGENSTRTHTTTRSNQFCSGS